jgi:hypothetical protein
MLDDLSVLDDSEGSDNGAEVREASGLHVTGGGDGSLDLIKRTASGSKSASSALSSLQATDTRASAASRNGPDGMKRPAAIERITSLTYLAIKLLEHPQQTAAQLRQVLLILLRITVYDTSRFQLMTALSLDTWVDYAYLERQRMKAHQKLSMRDSSR